MYSQRVAEIFARFNWRGTFQCYTDYTFVFVERPPIHVRATRNPSIMRAGGPLA